MCILLYTYLNEAAATAAATTIQDNRCNSGRDAIINNEAAVHKQSASAQSYSKLCANVYLCAYGCILCFMRLFGMIPHPSSTYKHHHSPYHIIIIIIILCTSFTLYIFMYIIHVLNAYPRTYGTIIVSYYIVLH